MQTISKIKHWILAGVLVLGFASCNDWLAVDMEDGMLEDKLFENNEGFQSALNGVYNRLNENYASTLTMIHSFPFGISFCC